MEQEKFDFLCDARRELALFIRARRDDDFNGVCASLATSFGNVYYPIKQKEINEKIMDYAQTLLNEINKKNRSTMTKKLVERISSRPYYRNTDGDHSKHDAIERSDVDCTMCSRYPCFKGMEVISSNLAITCRDFDQTIRPFNIY